MGWHELAALIAEAGDSLPHVVSSAKAALGWMRDPAMKAAACPPGAGFTVREFVLRSADSAYLVTVTPGRVRCPVCCRARCGSVRAAAPLCGGVPAALAEVTPGTFVLDDMPLTCPWAPHDVLADARSYLATVVAAVQTLAQLRAKFGKDMHGDTIRSACPVEVFTGGEQRHQELEAASAVIQDDTWMPAPRMCVRAAFPAGCAADGPRGRLSSSCRNAAPSSRRCRGSGSVPATSAPASPIPRSALPFPRCPRLRGPAAARSHRRTCPP